MFGMSQENIIQTALKKAKKAFLYVFLFSFAINLLMLALPIYSLQVLDRVLSSGSRETLYVLTLVVIAAFIAIGMFQIVRQFVLMKVGEWLEEQTSQKMLAMTVSSSAAQIAPPGGQNLRDIGAIRQFVSGQAITAIMDAPWSPIYLFVIFMVHPLLGVLSLAGCFVLILAALINERSTRMNLEKSNDLSVQNMRYVEGSTRNGEAVEAMGMMPNIAARWNVINKEMTFYQGRAESRSATISGIVRALRMILQIGIMGLGALLVLNNEISMGAIIASSILTSRVLAPFESAIATWKQVVGARKSYARLKMVMAAAPERQENMELPRPKGEISVENVLYAKPNSKEALLKGINFKVQAGQSCAIIGPSGAGKSSLAKLLVGVWKPNSGNIRLDSADVYTWGRKQFGEFVGYIPQDVELFQGSVKANIARMAPDDVINPEEVVKAAQIAGAHDMILHLTDGYETDVGPQGSNLSAGQRQRVALARAFYGNPAVIILDEPNSNLDDTGDAALMKALQHAKEQGLTVIVVTHRPTLLKTIDYVVVLKDGMMADAGPTGEILGKYSGTQAPNAQPSAPQPTLPENEATS